MRPNVIILNSQLLLLLIVGTASRTYIAKHRRLQDYSEADFALLVNVISSAPAIVLTPNTLTETSNLAKFIAEPARSHISELFRIITKAADERYFESSRAVDKAEFSRLGLTDAALLGLTDESHTLVTADLDLYLAAVSQDLNALYFNR